MFHTRKRRQRRGTTLVESAFVLPIFFLFLFGIFEYGQYEMVRQVVENASRAGARYAVVNSATASTSQVQGVVSRQLNTMPMFNSPTIQVFKADPTNGYKWCIGTLSQRQAKLQQAFQTVINGGVGVSLIQ